MAQATQDLIDYTKTSWIYELKKPELRKIIQDLKLVADENLSIDELRRIVRAHVSEINESRSKQADEACNLLVNKKPKIIHTMTESSRAKLEFHLGDDWETYTERLELYFVANDVKDEKQAAVLLTKISADTYKLIRDLCTPVKPSAKTFAQLVKLVNDHLNPKPSETMERCKFHQAQQSHTESVAEFAARLKNLSITCNFGNNATTALRDQLVCGLRDHATKTLLFREENLTFDKAFKLATTVESAEKNASSTSRPNGESSKETVNKFQGNSENNRQFQSRGKGSNRGKQGSPQHNNNTRPGVKDKRTTNINQERSSSCYCCGKNNHWARDCYHRFNTCNICKQKGHLASVCKTGRAVQHIQQGTDDHEEQQRDEYDFFMATDGNDSSKTTSGKLYYKDHVNDVEAEPMYMSMMINGKRIEMEIDTGSYAAIISKKDRELYFPNCEVKASKVPLKAYGKVLLEHEGILDNLDVRLGKQRATLQMRVMTRDGPILIGRHWLKVFGLWPFELKKRVEFCNKINLMSVTKDFTSKYPKLFGKGPGLYNKGMLKLMVKEGTKPVALKARHLPFALASKVEDEINRLVRLGHLEKIDVSEWATPIVPVIKSDGSVRICGNFKLTLNPSLIRDRHPIPLIDEIFVALRNGKTFSQIDLQHAYMQIPVEESSRDFLTIITHKGLYRYTKMTEGIASGPGDFQRKIEQCLSGIDGVIPYLDNIFVTGETDEIHLKTLYMVFQRLEQSGFHVNINKCDFFKEKLDLLGFVINKEGLHKSETKVKAMTNAPVPRNKKQLESFIGLITYYARFLPNRAEKLQPLYKCAKAETFKWTVECQKAVDWVKMELISPRVLAHYDPKEDLVLSCDASTYGLGAILAHRYKDGTEKPIAYASKVIPEKELNRAIIDKEASAIVFGFKKFYNYIYGTTTLTLRTDHKPLVFIFGPKQEIPLTVASRLQRWAYFLSRFTYTIESFRYIKRGKIAKETKKDKLLSNVIKYISGTWPAVSEMNEDENKFYAKRDELNVEKECLLWGYRIVVPEAVKPSVLSELHASHFGVVKMKMLARNYVWWPNIDKDIENVATACKVCVQERKKPPNVPLTPWPYPDKCWSRIHTDFLGPVHGHMFMVVMDAYSKWPEVIDMNKCTTAGRVIEEFKKIIVRYGLPKHVVTDNGTQFTSNEFREFCKANGIKQSFTAPHHPATNGAAENFVGRSPAFMMFKREIRTRFELMKPSVIDDVEKQQRAQIISRRGNRNVEFQTGDMVMVEDFGVRSKKRVVGTIEEKVSPVTFRVKVAPDKLWKRHVDQIIRYTPTVADNDKGTAVPASESRVKLRRSERTSKGGEL
ncbi:uncharacterized protein K02A2.6-like [Nylanderia fulva]|uniref:uncharacterized protein K02A2.6-like n=1 Tax=Nylanderia fulva TaxID=613905 RepID=UPI0010FB75FC|nr:uncharacterized protein K02A2.6-like [Nylanderia fulva]